MSFSGAEKSLGTSKVGEQADKRRAARRGGSLLLGSGVERSLGPPRLANNWSKVTSTRLARQCNLARKLKVDAQSFNLHPALHVTFPSLPVQPQCITQGNSNTVPECLLEPLLNFAMLREREIARKIKTVVLPWSAIYFSSYS